MLKRIANKILRHVHRPRITVEPRANLLRLGTHYGGKTFLDVPQLQGATIVSAGLGEDASFDVEFARRFGATVVIVDPTPRSIDYHARLIAQAGKPATMPRSAEGCLPIESYDMVGVAPGQLPLSPTALWINNETQRFYAPANPAHVSHSITNFQHGHRQDTAFIEVPSATLQSLLADHALTVLPLLKLDIEGAEVVVLEDLLVRGEVLPEQICVEFDELAKPSRRSREMYEELDRKLRGRGYRCVFHDGYSDYTYARI